MLPRLAILISPRGGSLAGCDPAVAQLLLLLLLSGVAVALLRLLGRAWACSGRLALTALTSGSAFVRGVPATRTKLIIIHTSVSQ